MSSKSTLRVLLPSHPPPALVSTCGRRCAGLTVIELLVVLAIVGLLIALLIPAVQTVREAARRNQCLSNLRQLGIAMIGYEGANRRFPEGSRVEPYPESRIRGLQDGVFQNGLTQMLPLIEEGNLAELYDESKPWYFQKRGVGAQVIPILICPSTTYENPHPEPVLTAVLNEYVMSGGRLGLTHYVFSKGLSDAFCDCPRNIPDIERGMFDYQLVTVSKDIRDGLTNTIAMGEGAGEPHWKLCTTYGCNEESGPTDPFEQRYHARQPWIGSGNTTSILDRLEWMITSHFATTYPKLNANPVTHFLFDDQPYRKDPSDCKGTFADPRHPSPHRVPGFRSDHPNGSLFLFADGSVRFFSQVMDEAVYQVASTVAGGDRAPTTP